MIKGLDFNSIGKKNLFLDLSLQISTFIFLLGYIFSAVDYIVQGKDILLGINIVSFALLAILLLLYKKGLMGISTALLSHIGVVTLNLYLGILHEALQGEGGSVIHVAECMCICIVPAFLSGMFRFRWLPVFITLGANVCYVVAAVNMGNPEGMLAHMPSFILVTIGIAYTLTYLLAANRHIAAEKRRLEADNRSIVAESRRLEKKNRRIEKKSRLFETENRQFKLEQKNFMELFQFTPKQLELLRSGRMKEERFNKLMSEMEKKDQEKIFYDLREIAYTDEQIKKPIREKHPGLSATDLELCALIVRGKTAKEIGVLRGIHRNSVTAHRSRLRIKLGLPKGSDLNDYLKSIVQQQKI